MPFSFPALIRFTSFTASLIPCKICSLVYEDSDMPNKSPINSIGQVEQFA